MDSLRKKKDGIFEEGESNEDSSSTDLSKSTDVPVTRKGNQQEMKGNWYRAVRFYNDSLRYGLNGLKDWIQFAIYYSQKPMVANF